MRVWALVGGVVLVVVIATVIVVAGGLGGGNKPKKVAQPTPTVTTNGNVKTCLYPSTVKVQSTIPIKHISLRGLNPILARHQLVEAEKLFLAHGGAWVDISLTGRRYLFSRGSALYIGTAHSTQTHLLVSSFQDATFTPNGKNIIYQKNPKFTQYKCANLVLMEMGLSGRHKHLLFAGNFSLLNSGQGLSAVNLGTLQTAMLSSGLITLAHGEHIYGFSLRHKNLGQIETTAIKNITTSGGANQVPAVQFYVSPNLQYMAVGSPAANQVTPVLTIETLPTGTHIHQYTAGLPAVWSRSGNRVAFAVWKQNSKGQKYQVIYVLNLKTAKQFVVKTNQKTYGFVSLGNIRWSKDGRRIAFTAVPPQGTTVNNAHQLAFISKWNGKNVTLIAKH